jgi:hypothetical protein
MTALDIRNRVLKAVDAETERREWAPVQRLSSTGACLRQQYYNITIAPEREVIARGSTWEIRDGDLHEGDVKRWFRDAGYTITHEQDDLELRLPNGSCVSGHPDGVISGPGLVVPHLLEVKSMSFMRYSGVVKNGIRHADPSIYLQINGYMEALDLSFCLLAVKAKDSSATKRPLSTLPDADPKFHCEIVPYDLEAVGDVYNRHLRLGNALGRGAVPDREFNVDKDWQCEWCAFRHECWGDDVDERIARRKKRR